MNGASSNADASLDGIAVPWSDARGQNFGLNPIATFELGNAMTGASHNIDFDDVAVSQSPF